MVDVLIGAVAKKVREAFGDEIEVYTESVYQNAHKPCFFVQCESSERIEMLNKNFFVRVHVAVTYENDSDEKRRAAESVTATLFDALSLVRVEDVCFNGRRIHGKWENGSMVIRAIYDMWTEISDEEHELMETIEVKEIYDGAGVYEG